MEAQEEATGHVMVGTWVPQEIKSALEELAKTNDRSVSGELRRALVKHLAESA
jgi:hypothetical protein